MKDKRSKERAEADYYKDLYNSTASDLRTLRAWLKENAPDVWRKYDEFVLAQYIVIK